MGAREIQRTLIALQRGGAFAKVVGVVVAIALVWLGVYWWASMRELETYQLRSRAAGMVKVADKCRAAIEEYYGQHRRMPRSDADVDCATDTPEAAKPKVEAGVITIAAAGQFAEALSHKKSGTTLRYAPACEGGMCVGGPIVSWDCKAGSTIEPRYRPATCR